MTDDEIKARYQEIKYKEALKFSKQKKSKEALKIYRELVALGHAGANYRLGWMHYLGIRVRTNNWKAFKLWEEAAFQGYVEAQFKLGELYYSKNCIVEQSYKESIYWYTKAAKQGNAKAQFNLGVMYYRGEGVEQDRQEATKWYKQSAYQDNADAQFELGCIYEEGEEAEYWYTKTANQGHIKAQYNLGRMYLGTLGIPRDDKKAIHYLTLAIKNGSGAAQILFKKNFNIKIEQ